MGTDSGMGTHLLRNAASPESFLDRAGLLMVTPRAMNYYLQEYKSDLKLKLPASA
jgi:hypothetical protein